jgi:hypothetical protein
MKSKACAHPEQRALAEKALAMKQATQAAPAEEWTISVPEAGRRYFGIGPYASYEAARCGQIPTIQVGRFKRVPVVIMERMLTEGAL